MPDDEVERMLADAIDDEMGMLVMLRPVEAEEGGIMKGVVLVAAEQAEQLYFVILQTEAIELLMLTDDVSMCAEIIPSIVIQQVDYFQYEVVR